MFVPVPVLVAVCFVFVVLMAQIVRLSRARDPLLGGRPAVPQRPSAAPPRAVGPAPLPVPPVVTLSPEIEERLRGLLAKGRKIEAIKLARDATRLGLKESKELVETLE